MVIPPIFNGGITVEPQTFHTRHVHAPILGLSLVKAWAADPVCFRQKSAIGMPASCALFLSIILASGNRRFRIALSGYPGGRAGILPSTGDGSHICHRVCRRIATRIRFRLVDQRDRGPIHTLSKPDRSTLVAYCAPPSASGASPPPDRTHILRFRPTRGGEPRCPPR